MKSEEDEPQLDQQLRDVLFRGCELARDLEQQLKSAPPPRDSALRSRILHPSMEIVSAFQAAIQLLKPLPMELPQLHADSPSAATPARKRGTPPLSPPAAARLASSPPLSSSPASDESEGSPTRLPSREPEGDAAPGLTRTESFENDPEGAGREHEKRKRRKIMPKITLKMHAGNPDRGNEIPPDDGHIWRKYGQKEILGTRYPRSYYRCTHKNDLGCQAIKQVQRNDEDPSIFDITYRGVHSCRSTPSNSHLWPFAFPLSMPQLNIQSLQVPQSQISSIAPSAVSFNSSSGFQLSPSLSPVQQPPLSKISEYSTLTFGPGAFPMSNLDTTPRFGMGFTQLKPEFPEFLSGQGLQIKIAESSSGTSVSRLLNLLQAQSFKSTELMCEKLDDGAVDHSQRDFKMQQNGGESSGGSDHKDGDAEMSGKESVSPFKDHFHSIYGQYSDSYDWVFKGFPEATSDNSSLDMPHLFVSPTTSEGESSHQKTGIPFLGTVREHHLLASESEVKEGISEDTPISSPFDLQVEPFDSTFNMTLFDLEN